MYLGLSFDQASKAFHIVRYSSTDTKDRMNNLSKDNTRAGYGRESVSFATRIEAIDIASATKTED